MFRQSGLAGELARQQRRFGNTVEAMYLYADRIVGRFIEAMDADTTLAVMSDHGFILGRLHEDPSKNRDLRRVSERDHRIEGILYLYGRGIKPHSRIEGAGLLDVAPTLLALGAIELAADMKGRVLQEALTFKAAAPTRLSWEGVGGGKRAVLAGKQAGRVAAGTDGTSGSENTPADAEAAVDEAILQRLQSLGYLDTASPSSDRNLAAIQFEEGQYQEAAASYRKLIAEDADDASLHASLAGVLASSGNFEEALRELDTAQAIAPLGPEIYHNRGAILERQGKPEEAAQEYAKAVRYAPDYQPSRDALQRLTGVADPDPPRSQPELLALRIATQAKESAVHGDYDYALDKIEEALRIAPAYPRIYQYHSNVAYLMGDTGAAIEALKKALELAPGNALYQANIESLRTQQE